MKTISVGPDFHLTPEKVAFIARNQSVRITLSSLAKRRVAESRAVVERMVAKKQVVYGVTTGFGNFKNKTINQNDTAELQKNLIRSHSVGVGEFLSQEMVRAALIVRLNSLAQGYSGVRLELLNLVCGMLNKNVLPQVPSQGSVGSSGDLAPLSHMGLVLMGEGEAWYQGKLMDGGKALERAGLKPIIFSAKEGLAWNNGTSVMTGIAGLVLADATVLADAADAGCALTLEAVCGSSAAFKKEVHEIRPHPGQLLSAERIRKCITGSSLVDSKPDRIQDAYSLRCAAQVHGAARDALSYARSVVERELNSVTDNPLIFSHPDRAISGGNFHGEPIAIAMDVVGIALSELANVSERRTAKLMDASTSEGLPMFLIDSAKAGLHSGLMMLQYTAAALVSENKVLAHPASVDSIPTSANQEDHVSMGTIAARKAWKILENVANVLAIEWISAAQGIDFRDSRKLGKGTRTAYQSIRKCVARVSEDRVFAPDIAAIQSLIRGSVSPM